MSITKETTARNPSVGADGGQPSKTHTLSIAETEEEFNENFVESQDFFRKLQRAQDPDFLNTVSYNELMDETLPCRRAVIEGLLGTGVYMLVGAPKIGKSFLVALVAYRVSTGTDLWGYRVHGGTVLYLALEDDKKRLQERMARMFGVEGCDNLHFATHAGQVGQNLDKQLQNFLREHPDTVLVIVDTLQKVREITTEGYSYASDYDVMTNLKQLADSYNICLLLVHHTRKQPAGDNFEMISGTNGLLGGSDGALLMKKENRTDLTATLELSSRDQPEQKLYITKNPESLVWELDHAETEPWKEPPDPILEAVAKLVTAQAPRWEGTPTELVDALNLPDQSNRLTRHLNVKAGRLLEEYGIAYENKARHTGRRITLRYAAEISPQGDPRRCDGKTPPPKTSSQSSQPSRIVAEGKEAVNDGLLE